MKNTFLINWQRDKVIDKLSIASNQAKVKGFVELSEKLNNLINQMRRRINAK